MYKITLLLKYTLAENLISCSFPYHSLTQLFSLYLETKHLPPGEAYAGVNQLSTHLLKNVILTNNFPVDLIDC